MNAILLDIPSSFETTRLHMRKPFPGDGEEVFSFLSANNSKFDLIDAEFITRELHIKFLKRELLTFHIYLKEKQKFIGIISLKPINWDIPYIQIEYTIDKQFLHNGFEKECLISAKYYAKHILQSKRIEIQCAVNDKYKYDIFEQSGFNLEAKLSNYHINHETNELESIYLFAVKN